MNLLLLSSEEADDGLVKLQGRRADHLRRVLRVGVGDVVRAGIIAGPKGQGVVEQLDGTAVTLRFTPSAGPDPEPAVDLLLALPRPKALRRLLLDAASLGVGRIDLVNAWRVEKSFFSSPALAADALQEQLRLGCEQGATTWVPTVSVHHRLMPCLEGLSSSDPRLRLLAEPGHRSIESVRGWDRRVLLAVGPEGGWIDRELETFSKLGFLAVSTGPAILRSEAAVTALLAQVQLLQRQQADSRFLTVPTTSV